MADMFDNDRIEELQAYVVGLIGAVETLLLLVEAQSGSDPSAARVIASARSMLLDAEAKAEAARVSGELRWRQAPDNMKRSKGQ